MIANIMPEGIELRFPLDCTLSASNRRRYLCVSGGETVEEEPDREAMPSLILRKLSLRRRCGRWPSSTAPPEKAFWK